MALINCDFYSDTLGMSSSMTVILPQQARSQIGMASAAGKQEGHPVLYLLHGLSDDHTIWLRRTSIERYVAALGIAVVMPNVHRSFYTNMKHGYAYWDFISEELPELVKSFFPISNKKEDTFVAGLSMGGYGALKIALSHPERYQAAASLSGAVDITGLQHRFPQDYANIFGSIEEARGSENDLYVLARQAAAGGSAPQLFQCCGTEDFLYADNTAFRDYARQLGLPLTYEEEAGNHDWGYWDMKIQSVLSWLPLAK